MELTYRELEELLALLHDVAPGRLAALRGRIKHFQRSGWPGGTNTGKGRPASYGFAEILKLALGFELLELGMTPERAIATLRENWDDVRTACSLAITAHPLLSTPQLSVEEAFDVFLVCDPNALAALSDRDEATDTFFYTSSPEFSRLLDGSRVIINRRLALINLSFLLGSITDVVPREDLLGGYQRWDEAERLADEGRVRRDQEGA